MSRLEWEPGVDRRAWLNERRAAVEGSYTRDAPTYDEGDTPISPTHRHFVSRLLDTCPPGGIVLDAPCGTGRFFEQVVATGRRVVGIDQSAGMAAAARARRLAVAVELLGLQELPFAGEFDAVMCIDAMEHVFPEDWPVVLANLHRAMRPDGRLYLTLEEIVEDRDAQLDRAFTQATERGLPVVRGEDVGDHTGGYHYYPEPDQVARWLEAEGLTIVGEGRNREDGWGYRHLLLRSGRVS